MACVSGQGGSALGLQVVLHAERPAALDSISFDDLTLLIRAAASGHGIARVTDTLA